VPPEPSSACEPCTGCAAIRFLGRDFATARPRRRCLLSGDCSRNSKVFSSLWPFVGLHGEYLPASTVVHDFEQRTMSGANGASDALGMGPYAGYTLNSLITALCVLTVSIAMSYMHVVAFVSDIHMHIYVITNLLMFYF
jgi:hypothetical protein